MDSEDCHLSRRPTLELLALSRAVVAELRHRGIVRTANAPVGDYAEYLVARAYEGELAPKAEKSWDVRAADGRKLQVKARLVVPPTRNQQLSVFRSFDFDAAVVVLLSEIDMSVLGAAEVDAEDLRSMGHFSAHVNGRRITTDVVDDPRARDVTERVRAASLDLPPPPGL